MQSHAGTSETGSGNGLPAEALDSSAHPRSRIFRSRFLPCGLCSLQFFLPYTLPSRVQSHAGSGNKRKKTKNVLAQTSAVTRGPAETPENHAERDSQTSAITRREPKQSGAQTSAITRKAPSFKSEKLLRERPDECSHTQGLSFKREKCFRGRPDECNHTQGGSGKGHQSSRPTGNYALACPQFLHFHV